MSLYVLDALIWMLGRGPVAGRWSLGLDIRISATDTVNVVSPILIR